MLSKHLPIYTQSYPSKKAIYSYVALLTTCTFATVVALGFCYMGHPLSPTLRVIDTRDLKVDQFYSGLLLSTLLAPIGLLIRRMSNEIALRHPFDIAVTKPISIADLDPIFDPGPMSLLSLVKYSKWRSFVQLTLMLAGWLLVPIGTIVITTGPYVPQTPGTAVVPLPTAEGELSPLHAVMDLNGSETAPSGVFRNDFFSQLTSAVVNGNLLGRDNLISIIPSEIGPLPHLSVSFTPNTTYRNILTYTWSAECQDSSSEVSYTLEAPSDDQRILNFTLPDNSITLVELDRGKLNETGINFVWHDPSVPIDAITHNYYTVAALADTPQTGNYGDQEGDDVPDELILDQGVWIARVKCAMAFKWRTATCTWDGTFMRDCVAAPPPNNTVLDIAGLDGLSSYMYSVPWNMFGPDGTSMFKWDPWPGIRPSVKHFEEVMSLLALALVTVASMSSWGMVEVPTVGETMRQVYIVRMYILLIVVIMLLTVTMAAIADLSYSFFRGMPSVKVSFWSIARAARGVWWDDFLETDDHKHLKARSNGKCSVKASLQSDDGGSSGLVLQPISYSKIFHNSAEVDIVEMYEDNKTVSRIAIYQVEQNSAVGSTNQVRPGFF